MTARPDAVFRPMEDRDRQAVLALSWAWAEENITCGYFAGGDKERWAVKWPATPPDRWKPPSGTAAFKGRGTNGSSWRSCMWTSLTEAVAWEAGCWTMWRGRPKIRGIKRLTPTGANRAQEPLLRFYLRRGMTLYFFRAFQDL